MVICIRDALSTVGNRTFWCYCWIKKGPNFRLEMLVVLRYHMDSCWRNNHGMRRNPTLWSFVLNIYGVSNTACFFAVRAPALDSRAHCFSISIPIYRCCRRLPQAFFCSCWWPTRFVWLGIFCLFCFKIIWRQASLGVLYGAISKTLIGNSVSPECMSSPTGSGTQG